MWLFALWPIYIFSSKAPNSTALPVCLLAGNLMVKTCLWVCACVLVHIYACMYLCAFSIRWFTTPIDNKIIKIWGNTVVPCLSHSVTSDLMVNFLSPLDIPSPPTLPVSNFNPWNLSSVSYTVVLCSLCALERLDRDEHYVHVCMTGFPEDQLHQFFVIETWRTNLKKETVTIKNQILSLCVSHRISCISKQTQNKLSWANRG